MTTYIAIDRLHVPTCDTLNWAALSIEPYILARGTDPEEVLDAGIRSVRHGDVLVFDTEGNRWHGEAR